MAEFSVLMAKAREELSISLRELSRIVGVSPGQLSNYERGASTPKREAVITISDALKIPINLALMASGFTPLYYNNADEKATRIADEQARYFSEVVNPNQTVALVSGVLESEITLELRSVVAHSHGLSALLFGEHAAALIKVDIALKLLKEAEIALKKMTK